MKKSILFGTLIIAVLAVVFLGKSTFSKELLNLKTVEALTEDDEWRNVGVPNSKTVLYTIQADHTKENQAFGILAFSIIGGGSSIYSGVSTVATAVAYGTSIAPGVGTIIGGVAGIAVGVLSYCAMSVDFQKNEQITCCGQGCGVCFPFAPDKSSIQKCKAQGFKVTA